MLPCKHCPRTFGNPGALACHQPYCKDNPERIQRDKSPYAHRQKGIPPWNKGLKGDIRCKRSDETKEKLRVIATGTASTPEAELERKRKITEKARLNNGGLRQGSGRGKKGWYKGFFCDSSWELAYLIYCLEHGKNIVRNIEKRKYEFNGKIRTYIPDFIVDGQVTEIKGYKTDQWMAKLNANPDVRVLYESDLKDIIRYVIDKYGKDYIKLYSEDRLHGGDTVLKTVPLLTR